MLRPVAVAVYSASGGLFVGVSPVNLTLLVVDIVDVLELLGRAVPQ